MKKLLLILLLFFLLLSVLFSFSCTSSEITRVCFQDNCFNVELAVTDSEHEKGLMFREVLDDNQGMLFVYDKEGQHNFWMKNTFLSLDIIWINGNQEVVFINKQTQPCLNDLCPVIRPNTNSQYVLEINAGLIDKLGLKIGDKLYFQ
jgi:uncharacterized protein